MGTDPAARTSQLNRDVLSAVRQVPSYWDRYRRDATFRHHTLFLILCGALLLTEIRLLSIDLPRHRELVMHTGVTAAILLLPLTVLALAARLPAGRRFFKRRFIVRPFGTLASPSSYQGVAIASLLHREISAWQSGARGSVQTAESLPPLSVSVAGTSLPLDWLWTQVRTLMTGQRDLVIEGLLIEAGGAPRELRMWTNESPYFWSETLDGEWPDALDLAIVNLTPNIFDSLDPELLADIYEGRWKYEEAVSLRARENSEAHQVELARLNLEGEYLMQAERHLEQAKRRPHLNPSDSTELPIREADLHMRRGNFREGRRILQVALNDPRCARDESHTLYMMVGDSYAYDQDFSSAIETILRRRRTRSIGSSRLRAKRP